MSHVTGGNVEDIPEGTPRKYPASGRRPVRLSVSSYEGLVWEATHHVLRIQEKHNPFWPCRCEKHGPARHEHQPWRDYEGSGRSRDMRFTSERRAFRALARVRRLIDATPTHVAEVEEWDDEPLRAALRSQRTGD